MAKGKLSIIGVTAATLAVSGCVKEIWEVTYPGPDDYYSEAHDIIEDNEQNPVLIGRTRNEAREDTLFLAKYDAAGNLLWSFEDPGFLNVHFPDKDYIATDSDGNVLFGGMSMTPSSKIGLLNSAAELLWEKTISGNANIFPLFFDVATTHDNQYLAITSENGLESYGLNGELLWQYQSWGTPGDTPDVNLGDYAGALSVSGIPNAEVSVNDQNDIFLATSSSLVKLDENGNELIVINYADFGDGSIKDIDVGTNNVAVLGYSDSQATLLLLNSNLEVINSHSFDFTPTNGSNGFIDLHEDSKLCFAVIDSFENTSTVIAGQLTDDSVAWQHSDSGEYLQRSLQDVQATADNCQVSSFDSVEDPFVTAYTHIYDNTGKLSDTLKIKDFIANAAFARGNTLYSAGITGNYDGEAGTRATLFKHTIR